MVEGGEIFERRDRAEIAREPRQLVVLVPICRDGERAARSDLQARLPTGSGTDVLTYIQVARTTELTHGALEYERYGLVIKARLRVHQEVSREVVEHDRVVRAERAAGLAPDHAERLHLRDHAEIAPRSRRDRAEIAPRFAWSTPYFESSTEIIAP